MLDSFSFAPKLPLIPLQLQATTLSYSCLCRLLRVKEGQITSDSFSFANNAVLMMTKLFFLKLPLILLRLQATALSCSYFCRLLRAKQGQITSDSFSFADNAVLMMMKLSFPKLPLILLRLQAAALSYSCLLRLLKAKEGQMTLGSFSFPNNAVLMMTNAVQ
jgi:hypothetical protein